MVKQERGSSQCGLCTVAMLTDLTREEMLAAVPDYVGNYVRQIGPHDADGCGLDTVVIRRSSGIRQSFASAYRRCLAVGIDNCCKQAITTH
jgi:hypothetical protein